MKMNFILFEPKKTVSQYVRRLGVGIMPVLCVNVLVDWNAAAVNIKS